MKIMVKKLKRQDRFSGMSHFSEHSVDDIYVFGIYMRDLSHFIHKLSFTTKSVQMIVI